MNPWSSRFVSGKANECTVLDGVYHTPMGRPSMVDISTLGMVSVPKKLSLGTSRRELSEDVRIVRYWHPRGCRAIELEKPP